MTKYDTISSNYRLKKKKQIIEIRMRNGNGQDYDISRVACSVLVVTD